MLVPGVQEVRSTGVPPDIGVSSIVWTAGGLQFRGSCWTGPGGREESFRILGIYQACWFV